ncbi:NUDIX domain-containing protein [Streptomyces bohaiensis]|uniref:NUDIX hydrolase n=1 Tax=Streptomyces bohaiensis TaxID=1431344 RepID=A0ABX1C9W2_9ACTN|nr:NUDIX hydrolase [Streptomyces bohaiensis]NJQ15929.1 NUDIX hydrolase [Streptomyces bohaiensis]
MIIWLNGAEGAGMYAAAAELVALLPDSVLLDPEHIGGLLRATLPARRLKEVARDQDLPAWRWLLVETAAAVHRETGGVLVLPLSVLSQERRDEMFGGLASRGLAVRHVLLDAEETILHQRFLSDGPAATATAAGSATARVDSARDLTWAGDHLPAYRAALPWLRTDAHVLDTSRLTGREAAERVAAAVGEGAGVCEIVQSPRPTAATVAAGMLIFDEQDRVLLVDPTYKPGWEFPGGVVEPGEPPSGAALREVTEELGLRLADGPRLLVVDWEPPVPPGFGGVRMLFDGGRLPEERFGELLLPGEELRQWRFVGTAEAEHLLSPGRFLRLRWALEARARGRTINLEAGIPVSP